MTKMKNPKSDPSLSMKVLGRNPKFTIFPNFSISQFLIFLLFTFYFLLFTSFCGRSGKAGDVGFLFPYIVDGPHTGNCTGEHGKGVGKYSSLKFDSNGIPHISYYDIDRKDLKYATFDVDYDKWDVDVVDGEWDVKAGKYSSLQLSEDGRPWIGYYDETDPNNTELKLVHREGDGWVKEVIDKGNVGKGKCLSMAIDGGGNLHFSYRGAGGKGVRYAIRYADGKRPETVEVDTVDKADAKIEDQTSIAVNSEGLPAILYYDSGNKNLKMTRCPASIKDCLEGPGAWIPYNAVDDTGADVGRWNDIFMDGEDVIHISYYNKSIGLNYNRIQFNGYQWNNREIVASGGSQVGSYNSIALSPERVPYITFSDDSSVALYMAWRSGGIWKQYFIDGPGWVGTWSSIAFAPNGSIGISYRDESNNMCALKFVSLTPR